MNKEGGGEAIIRQFYKLKIQSEIDKLVTFKAVITKKFVAKFTS